MKRLIDMISLTDLSLFELLIIAACLGIFFISYKTISLLNSFVSQLKASSEEKLSASHFKIFNAAVDNALQIITNVIKGLNEELVNDLKAKASDGKLTEDERIEILNNAVRKIKSQFSTEILNGLSLCIDDIDSWLVSTIHKTLGDIKSGDEETQKLIKMFTPDVKSDAIVSEKNDEKASLKIKQG